MRIYDITSIEELRVEKIIDEVLDKKAIIIGMKSNVQSENNVRDIYLKKDDACKINRYKKESDRMNFKISRTIVNYIYSTILGCKVDEILWDRNKYGKPYIENDYKIQFNITHTLGCVLVGFSKYSIGIDVEKVNRRFGFKDIVEIAFSEKDKEFINNNYERFFKAWTTKEAYTKCIGTGLYKELKDIEIIEYDNKSIWLREYHSKEYQEVMIFEPYSGYLAAVCIGDKENYKYES